MSFFSSDCEKCAPVLQLVPMPLVFLEFGSMSEIVHLWLLSSSHEGKNSTETPIDLVAFLDISQATAIALAFASEFLETLLYTVHFMTP